MALVTRPTKQGGFLTYAAKVLGGFSRILPAEFDADWQAIVNQVNGNIDATNIAPNSITNAQISPAAAIATAKLAIDAGIVTGMIAPGASVNALVSAALTASANVSNGEGTLLTLPTITTRGGRVLILTFGLIDVAILASGSGVISLRWKRGGVTQFQTDTLIQNSNVSTISVPFCAPSFVDSPAAGSYGYTLTAVSPNSNVNINTTGSVNLGQAWALELA